ncbi:hypothetical protein L6452_18766 [Arctium lappa]|uniref:Uncharacterized protein n=1 Tax=Arctium lappa TaxID=4217 RepID=A0ACB9C768_ARCLA|nr:hypothetical protein L6452_18766 [Arctium lappa]
MYFYYYHFNFVMVMYMDVMLFFFEARYILESGDGGPADGGGTQNREELYAGMGSENISSDSVADRITMDCNVDDEDLIMEDDIFDNIFDDGDVELEVDVDGEDLELVVGDGLQSHDDRC